MAAGIWGSNSGLGDANQALVSKAIQIALHESIHNVAAIGSPAVQGVLAQDQGLGNLLGARGISLGIAAIGQAHAAATAEGTEAAATDFSVANVTLSPARYEFVRDVSDFGASINASLLSGELSPTQYALIAYDGFRVWANTLIDALVALASSATYTAGTSGAALTWADLMEGVYDAIGRGANGPFSGFLSIKGAKDLANDALSLGGAVQMSAQVQQFLNVQNSGYLGRFFGLLDLYVNSELDTSGGDTLGIAISPDAVMTKHQQVPLPAETFALINAGFFTQEMRRPGGGVTRFSTATYLAAAWKQQAAGFAIQYAT